MTRKDYRLIAEAIRKAVEDSPGEVSGIGSAQISALRRVTSNLCSELVKDNPRFKAEVFVKACGF